MEKQFPLLQNRHPVSPVRRIEPVERLFQFGLFLRKCVLEGIEIGFPGQQVRRPFVPSPVGLECLLFGRFHLFGLGGPLCMKVPERIESAANARKVFDQPFVRRAFGQTLHHLVETALFFHQECAVRFMAPIEARRATFPVRKPHPRRPGSALPFPEA